MRTKAALAELVTPAAVVQEEPPMVAMLFLPATAGVLVASSMEAVRNITIATLL